MTSLRETEREAPWRGVCLGDDSDDVARNRENTRRLRRLVARLSDDDLRRELPEGWTVGDALAHLAFYDRRAQILLERFAREASSPRRTNTKRSTRPCLT